VTLSTVELLQETAAATAAASGHSRHVGLRRYTRPSTLPNSRRSRARLSSATSSSYRYRTNHSLTTPTTQTASDLRAPVLCQSSTPFSLHSTCGSCMSICFTIVKVTNMDDSNKL